MAPVFEAAFAPRVRATLLALSAVLGARPGVAEEPATEVVVEGERRAPNETAKEPAAATTVVAEDRLGAPGLGTAAALRGSPGALATEIGAFGSYATLTLRGSTAAQTPVYLGGVRVNDEVGGAADLGAIPLWFVERAEVYRGNAPVEADRLGIGGALFLEPRRPSGSFVEVGALVGSHQTREAWTAIGAGDSQNGVVAGVGLGAAENDYAFRDDRGTRFVPEDDVSRRAENADGSLLDVWLHGRRRLGETQLALLAHHGRLERGAPDSLLVPARAAREEVDRTLAALSTRTPLPGSEQWLEARSAAVISTSRLDDPLNELSLGATELRVSGARVEHALGARLRPHPSWTLRPGVVASLERFERHELGEVDRTPELVARRLDLRPAVFARYTPPGTRLALSGLAAVECTSTARAELSVCARSETTGRVGPSLRAGPLFVYANLGRYVRWPTLGELYGASPLVHGNSRLSTEIGETADLGGRFQGAAPLALRADAAVFVRRARDLIQYTQTAQGHFAPENLQRVRVLGLELTAGATLGSGLDLDVDLTATDGRDVSPERTLTNDVLPFQPRLVVTPRASFVRDVASPFRGRLGLHGRYTYEANRYADRAGTKVIPEQHNLELEVAAGLDEPDIGARVRVDNVLDRLRFDRVGFVLPGRSVYGSLEARW